MYKDEKDVVESIIDIFKEYNFNTKVEAGHNYNALEKGIIFIPNPNMKNKLFCTFTSLEDMEKTLVEVKSSYDILYKKIFVLYIKSNDEYVCTYNVEPSA
jgi:hypothetical protein